MLYTVMNSTLPTPHPIHVLGSSPGCGFQVTHISSQDNAIINGGTTRSDVPKSGSGSEGIMSGRDYQTQMRETVLEEEEEGALPWM